MSSADPRSLERIRHHFEVERELAQRLRNSTREERTGLFKTVYTELFDRVPDHPRLTRRENAIESAQNAESQLKLLRPYLSPEVVFLEFAPGDCRLSYAASKLAKRVVGVDISDQRSPQDVVPSNFELIIYNGYDLSIGEASVDVAFSYQFLEHLHPDDVDPHFELIHGALKPGGVYIFDTPHRYSGPHDVSRHFSNTCQGFHFQEWTYRQMFGLLRRHGFVRNHIIRFGKAQSSSAFTWMVMALESVFSVLPHAFRRKIAARLFPSVAVVAQRA